MSEANDVKGLVIQYRAKFNTYTLNELISHLEEARKVLGGEEKVFYFNEGFGLTDISHIGRNDTEFNKEYYRDSLYIV